MEHISKQYFDYQPVAAHEPVCSRYETDVWEVTVRREQHWETEELRETVIRAACFECGVIHLETTAGADTSSQTTHALQQGYASAPLYVNGAWLWPGPRIWTGDDRGPTAYFVTRAKERPRSGDDVVAMIGWGLGRRGGIRWHAGIGYTGYGVKQAAPRDFSSRRAAVRWIIETIGGAW